MPRLSITKISLSAFNEILSRYPSTAPAKLADLDQARYVGIPAAVEERKTLGSEDMHLEKAEVETLVEWKLKHGTFRPKLLQLVQSNDAELIEKTTREAFSNLVEDDPLPALKITSTLIGIGPATASLLLSVHYPDTVPFFSDEVFRWVTWGEPAKSEDRGGGWKRKIKYDVKEYGVLVKGVRRLRERLGVRAVDVERVAWVLGREGMDVGGDEEDGVDESKEGEAEGFKSKEDAKNVKGSKAKTKHETKAVKKGAKRKTEEPITPPEGVRRSSRRKIETDYTV